MAVIIVKNYDFLIRALSCSPWKYSKPTKLTMTGQTVIKPVVSQMTTKLIASQMAIESIVSQMTIKLTNYKLINHRKMGKTWVGRPNLWQISLLPSGNDKAEFRKRDQALKGT